jgi:multidrug efflux pump subunit AcrA (membrane-fusion protein)
MAILLTLTGLALAGNAVKGAVYKGPVAQQTNEKVSFKVSSNGNRVINFRVKPYPPNECGEAGPPPTEKWKPATISSSGTFRGTLSTVQNGKVVKSEKVTGQFLAKHKEKGTMKPLNVDASCQGVFHYSTKAQ